jgi:hypothetical protein
LEYKCKNTYFRVYHSYIIKMKREEKNNIEEESIRYDFVTDIRENYFIIKK